MMNNNDRRRPPRRDGDRNGRREFDKARPAETEENENQLEGRNALTEALRSGRTIDKVFIAPASLASAASRCSARSVSPEAMNTLSMVRPERRASVRALRPSS